MNNHTNGELSSSIKVSRIFHPRAALGPTWSSFVFFIDYLNKKVEDMSNFSIYVAAGNSFSIVKQRLKTNQNLIGYNIGAQSTIIMTMIANIYTCFPCPRHYARYFVWIFLFSQELHELGTAITPILQRKLKLEILHWFY